MKKVKILLALAMCSMYQSCSSDEVNMNPQEESLEKVVFKDDFETFDSNVWTKEEHEAGWVNQELQIYDAAHVSTGTDEGRSVLILTAERKGNKIYSGRVNSQGKKFSIWQDRSKHQTSPNSKWSMACILDDGRQ